MENQIGVRLYDLRIDKGLNLEEVKEGTGISTSTIQSIEKSDDRTIGHTKLAALAKFYGVTTDYLLGLSNTKSPNATMQAICQKTGLAESIVERLVSTRQEEGHLREANCLNFFLSSPKVWQMLHILYTFEELNREDEAKRRENLSRYENPIEALAADMADGITYQQDARKYTMIGMATEVITSLLPSTPISEMVTKKEASTHAKEK